MKIAIKIFCRKSKIKSDQFHRIEREIQHLIARQTKYKSDLIAQGRATIIPLISPGGLKSGKGPFSNGLDYLPTPFLKRCPNLKDFIDSLPGSKFSCRISTIHQETEMFPHRDHFRNLDFGVVRLHIPIETNDQIFFLVGRKKYNLKPNFIYYVDISDTHHVLNQSAFRRVHIILDIEVTPELLKLFNIRRSFDQLAFSKLKTPDLLYPLQKMKFKFPREKLPVPLSVEKTVWRFELSEKQWYLTSKKFSFKVDELRHRVYFLKNVGPGFQFFLSKKSIHFFCHGSQVISKNAIVLETLQHKIIFKNQLNSSEYFLYRSLKYIECRKKNKLILFHLTNKKRVYLLKGLSMQIWEKLFYPRNPGYFSGLEKKYPKAVIAETIAQLNKFGLIDYFFK